MRSKIASPSVGSPITSCHEECWGALSRILPSEQKRFDENIEATLSNGVLTIVLPKSAEAQKAEKTCE